MNAITIEEMTPTERIWAKANLVRDLIQDRVSFDPQGEPVGLSEDLQADYDTLTEWIDQDLALAEQKDAKSFIEDHFQIIHVTI